MFAILLTIFVIFVAADAFLAANAIHHLRRYALPGRDLGRVVILAHLAASAIVVAVALTWLLILRNTP